MVSSVSIHKAKTSALGLGASTSVLLLLGRSTEAPDSVPQIQFRCFKLFSEAPRFHPSIPVMKRVFGASVLLILTISFKVNITVVVVT